MSLEEAFRQSIEDFQLSRNEKKALELLIKETPLSSKNKMVLRSKLFGFAKEYATGDNVLNIISWLDTATKILEKHTNETISIKSYFSPGDECLIAICNELKSSKKSLDICVFTITDDRIVKEIIKCFKRGVTVRIISDNDKAYDIGSDIHRMDEMKIPIRIDDTNKHMHHKFMIVDDCSVLTGSYNWTRSAASANEENIIITNDPKTIQLFKNEFDDLWTKFNEINE